MKNLKLYVLLGLISVTISLSGCGPNYAELQKNEFEPSLKIYYDAVKNKTITTSNYEKLDAEWKILEENVNGKLAKLKDAAGSNKDLLKEYDRAAAALRYVNNVRKEKVGIMRSAAKLDLKSKEQVIGTWGMPLSEKY